MTKTIKKITEITNDQWVKIYELKEGVISSLTNEINFDDAKNAINSVWKLLKYDSPLVLQADSPEQMIRWFRIIQSSPNQEITKDLLSANVEINESQEIEKPKIFYSYWFLCWYYFFKGGEICGATLDDNQLKLFGDFVQNAPIVLATEKLCITTKNPVAIHWENGVLHNDNGLAIEYSDNTGIYSIHGVRVDEQIVMKPETQTLQQIDEEENAEIKRIRIERYGWIKYLEEKQAIVLEHRYNEIEQIDESLMACDNMKVLVCACPSTARIYSLEVEESCTTISDAQKYLSNGVFSRIIGAS